MSQASSLSEQDALTNAFLAVFAVLLLLLVQTGLNDVVARLEQRYYGAVPDYDPTWAGGSEVLAQWPEGELIAILASPPDGVEVTSAWGPGIAHAGAGVPLGEEYDGYWGKATARLWRFSTSRLRAETTIRVRHRRGAQSTRVLIGLDAALAGKGAPLLVLTAGEAIVVHVCPGTGAFAVKGAPRACP